MAESEWSLPLLSREQLESPYAWITIRGEERQLWQVGHLFGVTYNDDSMPGSGAYSSAFRAMYRQRHEGNITLAHIASPNAASHVADGGQFVEPLTCLSGWSGPFEPETPQHPSAHDKDDHSPGIHEMLAQIDSLVDEAWLLGVGEEGTNDAIAETEAILTGTVPEGGWASLYPRPLAIASRPHARRSTTTRPLVVQQHSTAHGHDTEEAALAHAMLAGAVPSPPLTRLPGHPGPDGARDLRSAEQTILTPTPAPRGGPGAREGATPPAPRETIQRATGQAVRGAG